MNYVLILVFLYIYSELMEDECVKMKKKFVEFVVFWFDLLIKFVLVIKSFFFLFIERNLLVYFLL